MKKMEWPQKLTTNYKRISIATSVQSQRPIVGDEQKNGVACLKKTQRRQATGLSTAVTYGCSDVR